MKEVEYWSRYNDFNFLISREIGMYEFLSESCAKLSDRKLSEEKRKLLVEVLNTFKKIYLDQGYTNE